MYNIGKYFYISFQLCALSIFNYQTKEINSIFKGEAFPYGPYVRPYVC